ncbi:palmitoyltransferase hip14 [Anaeramoeba ignava]|uniref:Palmitoyltransferase n=1 Tax=Anaeramoeba ignava TaxID=1746090 RepID=A0A9Q0LIR8_ANAIG|nr:palmitoyltransferase hip14 [Anaeramoeba ignava]
MLYFFKILVLGNPGIIKQKKINLEEEIKKFLQKKNKGKFPITDKTFCFTCEIIKPLRSKHDKILDKCIAKFDHTCGFTLNCVGYKNHDLFVIFLVITITVQTIFVWLCYCLVKEYQFEKSDESIESNNEIWDILAQVYQKQPWILSAVIQTIVFIFWETFLVLQQLRNVVANLTTNERINLKRYLHFYKEGQYCNPFDLGWKNNLLQFFKINYIVDWYNVKEYNEIPFRNEKYFAKSLQEI